MPFATFDAAKTLILIESGIRLHLTQFERDKADFPNGFVIKLRKHLRNARLESIEQGPDLDRTLDFTFATTKKFHLICEFFAAGNVILTDENYCILSLLRIVKGQEGVSDYAVNSIYQSKKPSPQLHNFKSPSQILEQLSESASKNTSSSITLRKALQPFVIGGQVVADHILHETLPKGSNINSIKFKDSIDCLQQISIHISKFEKMFFSQETFKGFIVSKKSKDDSFCYDEFHPFYFHQFAESDPNVLIEEFPCFNLAIDKFFSQIESQKIATQAKTFEETAKKKLDAIKSEQEKRVDDLIKLGEECLLKASAIEFNSQIVDELILVLQTALASGRDWPEIEELVYDEKRKGNRVALLIHELNFKRNEATIKLPKQLDSIDESDLVLVVIDLSLNAKANAKKYYNQRRAAAEKESKTIKANKTALKSAEEKIRSDMSGIRISNQIKVMRKPYWFEKFSWFISSTGYIVVAGRDAQQNELLVKRYMKTGDVYVHADMHGAASVIVKNIGTKADYSELDPSFSGYPSIPPSTLSQAGCMAICHSKAWDSKIVTSAWWVHSYQVSKQAPTGEYLSTGSFMIRGKKNFLPPSQLVYGFALLFKLDGEESILRHSLDRKQQLNAASATEGNDNRWKEALDVAIQDEQDIPSADEAEYENGEYEKELAETDYLNTLTGCPVDEDQLLFAIPVCAPYSSLQAFKYKVKLMPGALKKGKACKAALNLFLSEQGINVREKELIKNIGENELLMSMLNGVKLSAPGLTDLKKNNKSKKTSNK